MSDSRSASPSRSISREPSSVQTSLPRRALRFGDDPRARRNLHPGAPTPAPSVRIVDTGQPRAGARGRRQRYRWGAARRTAARCLPSASSPDRRRPAGRLPAPGPHARSRRPPRRRHPPALNALLNGASAVLLSAGWFFVRRRRDRRAPKLHAGGVLVSVLFLVSYVVYHALSGSRAFTGTGAARWIYVPAAPVAHRARGRHGAVRPDHALPGARRRLTSATRGWPGERSACGSTPRSPVARRPLDAVPAVPVVRGVEQIPWIYDALCGFVEWRGLGRWRRWLVGGARGLTLDLGCGTGRNLALLPRASARSGSIPHPRVSPARADRAPGVILVRATAEALAVPRRETSTRSSAASCSAA